MISSTPVIPSRSDGALCHLHWLSLALFVACLCIAIALWVVSVFVTKQLDYTKGMDGLAVGIGFAPSILMRGMAGGIANDRGRRYCMMHGSWIYTAAGPSCCGTGWTWLLRLVAYLVLVAGRVLPVMGEGLVVAGAIAWCFGVTAPQRSGLVFALAGTALHAAFAIGRPVKVALFERAGFAAAMAACVSVSLMVVPVSIHAGARPSFLRILRRIAWPGAALAFQGVGSATIGAFVVLMLPGRGWPHAGLGLTCFGATFVLVRIVARQLPDTGYAASRSRPSPWRWRRRGSFCSGSRSPPSWHRWVPRRPEPAAR